MTFSEWKIKMRACLEQYVEDKFGPDFTPDQVMEELPNMYKTLEAQNLVKFGCNYKEFVDAMYYQYNNWKSRQKIDRLLDEHFGRRVENE